MTLATMMLALGMELRVEDFRRVLREPRAAALGVFGQTVVLPCVALAMALLLPLALATAVGIVLLSACPGGATSNMLVRYARGDLALSISLTAMSSVLAPISVPLIVGLGLALIAGAQASIRVSVPEVIATLMLTTAMPVGIGMTVLRWFPAAAEKVRGKLLAVATSVLVLLLVGLAVTTAKAQPDVLGLFARSSVAVAILIVVCASIIAASSRWFGLPRPEERTLILEVGIQNVNLALVVALSFLGEPDYLGPTLVYLPFMLLMGAAIVVWGRCDDRRT